VALEEHLDDACGGAEVSVDLEGGVGVEEVGVDAAALGGGDALDAGESEEVLEHEVGVVAVVEACPEVDLPGAGPAGAAVTAELEGLAGGGEEVGGAALGNLGAVVEAPEVGDVAVLVFRVVLGLGPLPELAVLADVVRKR
jgi:hypothetical protein